mgnify:CR=1 FL=1
MMSSRLIRVKDAGAGGGHDSAGSRGGFYKWIDQAYTTMLAFAMRHRLAVSVLALLVIVFQHSALSRREAGVYSDECRRGGV